MNLDPKKVGAYKKFANKIWNATRFITDAKVANPYDVNTVFTVEDEAIYNVWKSKKAEISTDIDNYRLHLASEKIYDYFWHTLCDDIIENSKQYLNLFGKTSDTPSPSRMKLLMTLLRENIIVAHPFMPFVTEEIWSMIKSDTDSELLMVQNWNS
jgi:valyl-tRNA synthetase